MKWTALIVIAAGCSAGTRPTSAAAPEPAPEPEPVAEKIDAGILRCEPGVAVPAPRTGECVSLTGEFMRLYKEGQEAFLLGHFDEAIGAFRRARELQPTFPGPWRMLAALYEKKGDYERCLASARGYLVIARQSRFRTAVLELRARCAAKQSAAKPAPLPQQEPK